MEIKEFIKEVIGDITDAVIEINSEKCNSGAIVCPSYVEPRKRKLRTLNNSF